MAHVSNSSHEHARRVLLDSMFSDFEYHGSTPVDGQYCGLDHAINGIVNIHEHSQSGSMPDYQLLANCLKTHEMKRVRIKLCGNGSNSKGKFLELLQRYGVTDDNVEHTTLIQYITNHENPSGNRKDGMLQNCDWVKLACDFLVDPSVRPKLDQLLAQMRG